MCVAIGVIIGQWLRYHQKDCPPCLSLLYFDFRNSVDDKRNAQELLMKARRSMGPLFLEGSSIIPDFFDSFRMTGAMAGKDSKVQSGFQVNPSFVYSSVANNRFVLPEGTVPILGFACASVLVDVVPTLGEKLYPYSCNITPKEKLTRVVACAKNQFRAWCFAFHENHSITIYYHNDDPIRFCHSLHSVIDPSFHNVFNYCSAPWNPPRRLKHFNGTEHPSI